MAEYFFNITTSQVEEGRQSPGSELIGPYATPEEASKALETIAKRNEKLDEEDAVWENGRPDS